MKAETEQLYTVSCGISFFLSLVSYGQQSGLYLADGRHLVQNLDEIRVVVTKNGQYWENT